MKYRYFYDIPSEEQGIANFDISFDSLMALYPYDGEGFLVRNMYLPSGKYGIDNTIILEWEE